MILPQLMDPNMGKGILVIWLTLLPLIAMGSAAYNCSLCQMEGCAVCNTEGDTSICNECCEGYYKIPMTAPTDFSTTYFPSSPGPTSVTYAPKTTTPDPVTQSSITVPSTTTKPPPTVTQSSAVISRGQDNPPGLSSYQPCMLCSTSVSNCTKCTNAAQGVNCLACSIGTYLHNGQCESSCPTGYIPDSGTCKEDDSSSRLAIIIGCSVAGAVVLVILLILLVCCLKRRKKPPQPTPALPRKEELDRMRHTDTLPLSDSRRLPSAVIQEQVNHNVEEEHPQGRASARNGKPGPPSHSRVVSDPQLYENPDDDDPEALYVNNEDDPGPPSHASYVQVHKNISPLAPRSVKDKNNAGAIANRGKEPKIPKYENAKEELDAFHKNKGKGAKDYVNVNDTLAEYRESKNPPAPSHKAPPQTTAHKMPPKGHASPLKHGYVNDSVTTTNMSKYDKQVPIGGGVEDEYITKDQQHRSYYNVPTNKGPGSSYYNAKSGYK